MQRTEIKLMKNKIKMHYITQNTMHFNLNILTEMS